MSSTFKGLELFNSGPHRFAEGPAGQLLVPRLRLGQSAAGSVSVGKQDLVVTIRGRLIDQSDELLWEQIDLIKSQLDAWAAPGDLIDHALHAWTAVNFVSFQPADRIDRAVAASLAYTALFVRLT